MNGYEYKDQHFSVEIAETLILEKTQTTGALIEEIKKHLLDLHLKSGGLGLEDDEFGAGTLVVQSALRNCEKKAQASFIRQKRPRWRIAKSNQWIFGTGKHWVYLYYFSRDKSDAASKGLSLWECKIGRADGVNKKGRRVYDAPERRVKSQTSGCPKTPIIGLLFRTNRHVALEKAIHGILTVREQDIPQNQGTEWFLTNPCEVVEIVAKIDYGLLSPVNNLSPVLLGMERKILR